MENNDQICWYKKDCIKAMNDFYDKHSIDNNDETMHHYKYFKALLSHVKLNDGDIVLDVGCGTGVASRFIQEKTRYIGLDLSAVIDGCAKLKNPGKKYTKGDITDPEYSIPDARYKLIFASALIDVMEEPLAILEKILCKKSDYVLIHRQEVVRESPTRTKINPSYSGYTYHSIVNEFDINDLCEKYGYQWIARTNLNYSNWHEGGLSFLLRRK